MSDETIWQMAKQKMEENTSSNRDTIYMMSREKNIFLNNCIGKFHAKLVDSDW